MKKKILALSVCVVMLAVAIVGGTLAYFTDTDDATNVFTVGNVDITLTEPNWDKTGKNDADTVYPGEALAKDPTVTNVGANPCFVRISITGLDQFRNKGSITYETGYQTGKLGAGWVLHTDGYFYYTKPLIVKGTENESWNTGLTTTTTPLFDQIRMPVGLDGSETNVAPIVVKAEAVQAQGAAPSWSKPVNGKPPVVAMSVEEIAAWFDVCMPDTEETTAAVTE